MSNRKLFDVGVATGTYTANGQEKKSWLTVGALYERDNGDKFIMLKAFFNPAAIERQQGQDSIPLYLFPPKDKQGNNAQRSQPQNYSGERHDFSFDAQNNNGFPF